MSEKIEIEDEYIEDSSASVQMISNTNFIEKTKSNKEKRKKRIKKPKIIPLFDSKGLLSKKFIEENSFLNVNSSEIKEEIDYIFDESELSSNEGNLRFDLIENISKVQNKEKLNEKNDKLYEVTFKPRPSGYTPAKRIISEREIVKYSPKTMIEYFEKKTSF